MRWSFVPAFVLLMLPAGTVLGQSITSEPSVCAPVSPDKGSVFVSADPQACASSSTLTLAAVSHRITVSGRNGTSRSAIASSGVGLTCRWRIDRLDPGEYEVDLSGPGGSGGAATFTASAGTLLEVQIPISNVRVTGTIRVNGLPVTRARLVFFPGQASQRTVDTAVDGSFDVTLERPGDYRVMISGDSVFSQSTGASFEAGAHKWDWDIVGGVVTVEVIAAGSEGDLDLFFDQADGSLQSRRIPNGWTRLVRQGVPVGAYQLSLKRRGERVSDVAVVTIEGNYSSVDVVLREFVR